METSPAPPKPPRLVVGEENAPLSQVLEIIGGITLEALQTLAQPEEWDAWATEEGDDSVFYSDEDQTHPNATRDNSSCGFGADEATEEPNLKREDEPGAEDKENVEMEKVMSSQILLTEQEKCRQLQIRKTEHRRHSDSPEPGAEVGPTPEDLVSTRGESLQPDCTNADTETQNVSPDAANRQVEEEPVLEVPTPNLQPFAGTNGESSARQNAETEVSEKISADGQTEVDQRPEQDRNFHAPVGFHRGYSTLPLLKKPSGGNQSSFDDLTTSTSTSSMYSTVSYRKIRKGNTRQRIEEFEYMIMHL